MKREKMIILPQVNTCGGDIEKKWFVFYSVRDPRTGKMKRFKSYTGLHQEKHPGKRLQLANELAQDIKEQLLSGWSPFEDSTKVVYADQLQYRSITDIYQKKRGSNKTVHYLASQYLERISMEKEHATVTTYRSKLRTFSLWVESLGFGENDISSINNGMILDFFSFLINDRKLSGNSIGKYKQMLFGLFEFAVEQKTLFINPVYNIPRCRRINDHAPRPVQRYDIDDFKYHIQKNDPQLWMAIEFQYYCYIRPGNELRLLKVGDIDFARGLIYLNRENFKTRRENVKEIPESFLLKMRNEYQLHRQPRDYYVFGRDYKPGPEHLGKNNLRFRFVKYRKELNMPEEYKFYSWKHTGGVLASEAGIPEKDISDQMGHTNIRTTSTYLKAKGGRRIESIRKHYPKL